MNMQHHPDFDRDHAVDYTSYQDSGPTGPLSRADRRYVIAAWVGFCAMALAFVTGLLWALSHV